MNGFGGGQMPLHMRLPKRGFKSRTKDNVRVMNLHDLQILLDRGKISADKIITEDDFRKAGALGKNQALKILGRGNVKEKLYLHVALASESARKKIENLEGKIRTYATRSKSKLFDLDSGNFIQMLLGDEDSQDLGFANYMTEVYVESGRAILDLAVIFRERIDESALKEYSLLVSPIDIDADPRLISLHEISQKTTRRVNRLSGNIVGDDPSFAIKTLQCGYEVTTHYIEIDQG